MHVLKYTESSPVTGSLHLKTSIKKQNRPTTLCTNYPQLAFITQVLQKRSPTEMSPEHPPPCDAYYITNIYCDKLHVLQI